MSKTRSMQRETRETRVEKCFCPASQLLPKNASQGIYIDALRSSPVVIATGYPGTGKTYIPARIAGDMYKRGYINTIVLSRPSVSTSNSIGFFKGTKNEKMLQWLAPVLGALREEFPPSQLEYMMKDDVEHIVFSPLETIKGLSWSKSFIIIDEAEDLTFKELRSILTRIGTGSTIVLCGDLVQTDLRKSGLQTLLDLMAIEPKMKNIISHVNFNKPEEIIRSSACRELVLAFERSAYHFQNAA